jgi:hypothetical protein
MSNPLPLRRPIAPPRSLERRREGGPAPDEIIDAVSGPFERKIAIAQLPLQPVPRR